MSEGHFHVHGPHDHEVEHAAHTRRPVRGRIAVMTAIFATIGALFGYMAGATQNDALLFKNEAAIRKTEASDQWNFYQAKSSKQNLAELGATLSDRRATGAICEGGRALQDGKGADHGQGREARKESAEAEAKSEASMHVHHRWAQAMTLIQIAIALAAITILTRQKPMGLGALGVAIASIVLGLLAAAHI